MPPPTILAPRDQTLSPAQAEGEGAPAPGRTSPASVFGSRVLAERQRQALSQRALAERAGLAPSSISKIENARVSPTYDVMLRLATALGTDVGVLLGAADPAAVGPGPAPAARLVVDRADGRARHPAGVYDYAPVTLALKQRIMDPTLIHVAARSLSDFGDWVRHPGEEFVLVLSGRVTLHTEHYAPVVLAPFDAAYFDAEMGHAFTSEDPGATLLNITAVCRKP